MSDRLDAIRKRCEFTGTYPTVSSESQTDVAFLLAVIDGNASMVKELSAEIKGVRATNQDLRETVSKIQKELDAYRPALARCASEYQALHEDYSQGYGCAAYWLRQEGWTG